MKRIILVVFTSTVFLGAFAQDKTYTIKNDSYILEANVSEIRISSKDDPSNERILKPIVQVVHSV
ncbi:MAG: hypothetical protein WD555_06145, partial [Fulvivirga sp.]